MCAVVVGCAMSGLSSCPRCTCLGPTTALRGRDDKLSQSGACAAGLGVTAGGCRCIAQVLSCANFGRKTTGLWPPAKAYRASCGTLGRPWPFLKTVDSVKLTHSAPLRVAAGLADRRMIGGAEG